MAAGRMHGELARQEFSTHDLTCSLDAAIAKQKQSSMRCTSIFLTENTL